MGRPKITVILQSYKSWFRHLQDGISRRKEEPLTLQSIYKSPAGEQAVMALYDSWLARWPAPYTTLTEPTRHGSTFVIASGAEAAPPLVLIHGAGTNSTMWAGDVADYSRLSAEVDEEVRTLQDHLEALEEVRLGGL